MTVDTRADLGKLAEVVKVFSGRIAITVSRKMGGFHLYYS